MKVVVMGAGIAGVTSAYFLARYGHEVTVIEKAQEAGSGCSFANGGQLSFSHIEPFSSRSSFGLILKSLLMPNSFSSIQDFKDRDFLKFCLNFIGNYGDKKTKEITKNLFELGQESRRALNLILKEENIDFNYSNKGILHFFRNRKLFERAMKQAEFQVNLGDKIEILNRDETIETEPTLTKLYDENKLLGGILHKNDAAGDALAFTKALAKICRDKYNVRFYYNTEIKNILTNFKKITGINTSKEVYTGDCYVYAMGAYGNKFLKGIEMESKILPVRGYSLSIPCDKEFIAPNIGLTDPENKIVYSRIGDVFRAAGTVEVSKSNQDNERLISFIKNRIKRSFSDYGNIEEATSWRGVRPFRANSTPLIKKSEKYGNLFLNAGHGHLGWSMSCGSSHILSELIAGKEKDEFAFLKKESC